MKKIIKGISIFSVALALQSCGETALPDPNPGGFDGLDFTININNSPYTPLQNVGGYAIATAQKVMIARPTATTWAAVSSTCPNDASLTMRYNANNNTFSCGNVTYNSNGKVSSGSSADLKRYFTTFTNNSGILRVYEQ